jgi:hypothetical protein
MNRIRIFMAGLCLSGLCLNLAYSALRLGFADYLVSRFDGRSLARAAKLAPYRADIFKYLDLVEAAGGMANLRRSAALNPADAQTWTLLGLSAEASGQAAEAERYLLEASRRNRGFEPRWVLANFYFRRHDAEPFWYWARQAAALSYNDPEPLIRLCWKMNPDASEILRRLSPCPCGVTRSLLNYLTARGDAAEAEPVTARLMTCREPAVTAALLAQTSALILQDRPAAAVRVWNLLSRNTLIPYPPLDPGAGARLENGDFSQPLLREGFDWRVERVPGVIGLRLPSPTGFELTFDGTQPEGAALLYQAVILKPDQEYNLTFVVSPSASAGVSGLHWRLIDFHTGAPMSPDSADIMSDRRWEFRSPTHGPMPFLALVYIRPNGTPRFQGAVRLAAVHLGN